ncbi:hypothetical protein BS78_K261800 [Paspalum vaginatum]|uniref:Uncharacterized protein n=1 Tax=Paspalum vaginatum TaxID=158149 RepID=A0A9W8CEZ6_9POAL|nr:hypothetical protein BS78_K261800 [Paspalum vaginatum]
MEMFNCSFLAPPDSSKNSLINSTVQFAQVKSVFVFRTCDRSSIERNILQRGDNVNLKGRIKLFLHYQGNALAESTFIRALRTLVYVFCDDFKKKAKNDDVSV